MSLTILMANTFGCPTANSVNYVSGTFDSPQPVSETMPERVDDASIRNTRFEPLVQCGTR